MRLIPCLFPLLACCGVAWAQTNGEPVEPVAEGPAIHEPSVGMEGSNAPPTATEATNQLGTQIYSDSVQLGIKTRTAIYRGHVRLEDPRIHLTCEQLTASVPEKGTRVDRVVAETNVVIVLIDGKGKTNTAYASRAVYTYSVTDSGTNEIVELTGPPSPRIEREEGILYGDVIVWDRTRNQIRATHQRMIYRAEAAKLTNNVPQTMTPPAADGHTADEPPAAAGTRPDE